MKINKYKIKMNSLGIAEIVSITAATIICYIKLNNHLTDWFAWLMAFIMWSLLVSVILFPLFGIIYFFALAVKHQELKTTYLRTSFRKVKIDFGNHKRISNKILRCEDIETFARILDDETIEVKVIFEGNDDNSKPVKFIRIYQFKDYEIDFLEIEE